MKRIFLILIFACLCLSAYASGDWKGRVLDENGQPLPYATVALLSSGDSTLVAGTTSSQDGSYKLLTSRQSGILMVSMVGYRTQYLKPEQDCILTMQPDVSSLTAATAVATMPKVRLTGEGMRTSVRGSVLENVGTAKNVLEKTPGIIKTADGLEVIGKGKPLIYINGHRMTDEGELDRLQSTDIQSVEVITNPGAQYDASVMSVVRIRTYRRDGEGFGYTASLYDSQSLSPMTFNDPSANLNMNYRLRNVDFFGGFDASHMSSVQKSDLTNRVLASPECTSTNEILAYANTRSYEFNGGVNWQFADNHSAGFKLDYTTVPYRNFSNEMTSRTFLGGELFDVTDTRGLTTNGEKSPRHFNTNLYYNGQIGKLGIDFNSDYYTLYNSEFADIRETSDMREDARINTATITGSSLWAAKLVLSYPIWKGQLQAGTEETFTRNSDDYEISGTELPGSSSTVREGNCAAFATYAFVLPKVGQFSAGVRYEHVDYSYAEKGGEGDFTRKYDNLFPTFAYATQLGPVSLLLNYSEKTRRPGFSMLSNAIQYNSRYILQSGNAALQPQTVNDLSLMANCKWLTFTADWSRTRDAMMTWSERYNDEGVVMVRPINMQNPFDTYVCYLNASPTIGIWSLNYTAGLFCQRFNVDAPDPREPSGVRTLSFNDNPIGYLYMANVLKLKGGWQLEFGCNISTPGYQQNILSTNTYCDINAAIQKSFLRDGALVVRLSGSDLAGLGCNNLSTDFGSVFLDQNNVFDTQRITLSVRYSFNTARSKYKGTGSGQDAISRLGSK